MKGKLRELFERLLVLLGIKSQSEVDYISQTGSLPSPFTPEEETATVKKFLAGDEEARL